ncbi:MAG: helicase-related protein [Nanoarchaeota archaeon]|nr:helicase-related protein [Nanoarchaeota archaeon]
MKEIKINPRDYQQKIFEKCIKDNCLVVLPTGTGKTLIAIMLAVERFKQFPLEKVLILAPTRPLVEQHFNSFKKILPEDWADMQIFTGKTPAEQRKKIWQTAEFIFSTPQCIGGDTLIFTKEGPIKISNFFKKFNFKKRDYENNQWEIAEINEKVLGYDGEKTKFLKATKALKSIAKNLIKIKTDIGNTILCTEDHPLLTIDLEGNIFWKQASQLNKEDYIASVKKINQDIEPIEIISLLANNKCLKIAEKSLTANLIKKLKENKIKCSEYSKYFYNFMPIKLFLELSEKINLNYSSLTLTDKCGKSSPVKVPRKLDNKLAYILGAMLGDGHLGNRKNHGGEVVFSDLDRESVSNEFKEVIKEIFGIEMKKENKKGLIAYNSALSTILTDLGIPKGNKAKIIKIPRFLFFAEQESVKGFIKGIFDTDGNASKYHVSISSASESFIQELKWLFLKIGILGSTEKRINKGIINNRKIKESEIFTFRFSGRKNLQKFLEVSPNKEKCEKLIKTLNNTKKPETRSKEILPISKLMKKIYKENTNKAERYKFSCLSTDNLRKLSENLDGENALKLKELLKLPIRWVKIKEKEKIYEEQEVYDLTIEKEHNFITNCLISHNCISNDLNNNLYNLSDTCLLIQDECHRCLKNYSYTLIAQKYKEHAKNQKILGLTASPGSDKQTISKVCENLGIDSVEIRTRDSEDVKPYLQELNFEKIEVEFPSEFEEIRQLLKGIYDAKIEELKNRKVLFTFASKKNLLDLQRKLMGNLNSGEKNPNIMMAVSVCSQAIKIQHALELLETQTISAFIIYLKDLYEQANQNKSKGVQRLVKDSRFAKAYSLTTLLSFEHPKLKKLFELVKEQIEKNPNSKIIIFSQYRETVRKITETLNKIPLVKAEIFVGQTKKGKGINETGINQKEQKKIIEDFSEGKINCLVATSIAEEGLDIPEVNEVIFYEPIPSAIRKIQRAGRTARLMPGALKILITKNTRDEAYYYASGAKEKKMYSAIESIRKTMEQNQKETIDKTSCFCDVPKLKPIESQPTTEKLDLISDIKRDMDRKIENKQKTLF